MFGKPRVVGDLMIAFWWNNGDKPRLESVQEKIGRDELKTMITVSCLEEFYYEGEQKFGTVKQKENHFFITFSFSVVTSLPCLFYLGNLVMTLWSCNFAMYLKLLQEWKIYFLKN